MHPLMRPIGPGDIGSPRLLLITLASCVLVVTLVVCALLVGCSDDDEQASLLPTVAGPPPDRVTCHDFLGVRPDREVQRARTEANPHYCYIGGECFFRCPTRG
jgi:hypothetical protein